MSSMPTPHAGQNAIVVLVGGLHTSDVWKGIESDSQLKRLNLRFHRFTYGYQTAAFSALTLNQAATSLYRVILEVAHEEADLIFVGHSLGGIILQKLLTGPGNDLLDRVRLVLLVATPVSPKWLPIRLRDLWPFGRSRLVVPNDIDSLNEEWDLLRKERGLRVVSVVGLRDKVAPYDAGRHWDSRDIVVANQDHVGLAHDTHIISMILYDQLKGSSDTTAS